MIRFPFLLSMLLAVFLTWNASSVLAQAAPDCAGNADPCSNCGNLTNANYSGTCTTGADAYSFTMKEMRLRKTDGTFVSIANGDMTFNAAAVTAGAQIGAYASGSVVPPASYDAMSPTLGKDWSFSGSTTGGAAGSCASTAGGFSVNTADQATRVVDLAAFFIANPGAVPSDMTVTADSLTIVDSSAGLQVTVNNGQSLAINIQFDTGTGAQFTYVNGVCQDASMGELGVTVTLTTN